MPSYLMYIFSENIPEKLWLKRFNKQNNTINLSGVSIDNPTIVQFIARLKKTKIFSKIELIQVSQILISGYKFKRFSMNIKINQEKVKKIL